MSYTSPPVRIKIDRAYLSTRYLVMPFPNNEIKQTLMQFNHSYLLCDATCAWCCTAALCNKKKWTRINRNVRFKIPFDCTLRDGKFSVTTMEAQMSRDFYIESIGYANIFLFIEIAARRNLRQVHLQTSRNSTT